MPHRRLPTVVATIACSILAAASFGCGDSYDWERDEQEYGTLGEELFAIWREDAARAPEKPEARVAMLDAHEREFVESVDQMAPPDQLERVDTFLRKTNPSIDSGLLPSLTRKIEVATRRAGKDGALHRALASRDESGYRPFVAESARPNLPRYLLTHDRLRPATRTLSGALLAADGVDATGAVVEDEATAFARTQRAAAGLLRDVSADESGPATELQDVLVREDGRLQASRDVSLPVVRFDRRGLPRVVDATRNDDSFMPVGPFVDRDGDGLADVDSEGRFVRPGDENIRLAAFGDSAPEPFARDEAGRATLGGTPVFEYVELADTGLHWTIRHFEELQRKDAHWKLLEAAPALLGDRVRHADEEPAYRGYAADQPLVDVLETTLDTLNFETLPAALRSLADFMDGHTPEIARLLDAFRGAKEKIDALPNAELTDDSTIGYDLIPILEETAADDELWADVMEGLGEPVVAKTGTALATLLEFKGRDTLPDQNGTYNGCFQQCKTTWEAKSSQAHPHGIGKVGRFECIRNCAIDELFTKKTAFDQPEAVDNRSANQQLFHLLRDTAGTPYTLEIVSDTVPGVDLTDLPPIIELPGSAEAFVRSVAGNLNIKNYVSQKLLNDPLWGTLMNLLGGKNTVANLLSQFSGQFGAHLDKNPTPDQITRLFNQADIKATIAGFEIDVSDPVCKDGYVMANHHADKLYAAEASGLIDAVQPLAKAFSDHRREELFTALFEVVHAHYSKHDDLYKTESGSPSPMKGSNLVSFEPALYEIARTGRVFGALQKFARAVLRTKPVGGVPFEERLRQLVYNAVRSTNQTGGVIRGPNGQSSLTLPDGTKIQEPSRMHYLLDSVGRLVDRLEGQPTQKRKLTEALETFTEVFVATENPADGAPQFENPGTIALLSLGARQLAETAADWVDAGTLEKKLTDDAPESAERVVTSRALPAAVDLVDHLRETEKRRTHLDGLTTHLVGEPAGRDQLATAAYQWLAAEGGGSRAPIAEEMAAVIDPDREWSTDERSNLPIVSHALTLVRRLVDRDRAGTGFDIARRGLTRRGEGQTALGSVGEVVADYYRRQPDARGPYDAADYRRVFTELAAWLGDDVHGLEQLYDIIGRRSDDD